ncbi:MAG TPA: ABC transporter permease, partial [Candidatus Limnocylindrales bacterium]
LFVIINLPKRSTGTDANVPLRGVSPAAAAVRGNIRFVAGRPFQPGRNELAVGIGAARQFAGLDLGRTLRIGNNDWTVVGLFAAGGGVAESELWTDARVLQPLYHRGDSYQAVYARLASAGSFPTFKDALTANPALSVDAVRQSDFYAEQSTQMTDFIAKIGVTIAVLMALGALFGALNTMYSSVAARTREIATLRALGFGATPVIASVLLESLVLALAGGAVGAALAYVCFNGFQTSTINWQTFSQVAFAFRVTPPLLVRAIVWAACLGLLGGFLPALRAARVPVAVALRET